MAFQKETFTLCAMLRLGGNKTRAERKTAEMKFKFLLILISFLTTTNANIINPSFELGIQFNPYIDMGNIKSKLYNYPIDRLYPQLENKKLRNLFDWMPGINLATLKLKGWLSYI